VRLEVEKTGRMQVNAVVIDLDRTNGKARNIRRVRIDDDQPFLDG
jgi:calcineurin-like phosphoesterase